MVDKMGTSQKNMNSMSKKENIPCRIPLRTPVLFSNEVKFVQMKMNMICSTPLQNPRKLSNIDDSDQLGSPITKAGSVDMSKITMSEIKQIKRKDENESKETVLANTSSTTENKKSRPSFQQEHKYVAPGYNMVLYSSDEDDIWTTTKKIYIQKNTNRKRKNLQKVVFSDDADNVKLSKYKKNIENDVDNENIDEIQNNDKDSDHEKLINMEVLNINNVTPNKIDENNSRNKNIVSYGNNIDGGKMLEEDNKYIKRKYTKKKKNYKLAVVQTKNILFNVANISEKAVKTCSNEQETRKISILPVMYNKNTQMDTNNSESKEPSQDSENSGRKSARQRVQPQPYWIAKSNCQSSESSDATSNRSEENSGKKKSTHTSTRPREESFKKDADAVQKFKKEKKIKRVMTSKVDKSHAAHSVSLKTINKNSESKSIKYSVKNDLNIKEDNVILNTDEKLSSDGITNKPVSVISDVSSHNDNDTEEKERNNQLIKKNKKPPEANLNISAKKVKNMSSNMSKSNNLNSKTDKSDSSIDSDMSRISSDTLVDYFNDKNKKSKSNVENNTVEEHNLKNLIDKYSFKQIALAQRNITEAEHVNQAGNFGKFPEMYQTYSNNTDLCMGINIWDSNFVSGVLEILPSGKKERRCPKNDNMFFFILEGIAEVNIGNVSKILSVGDSFYVPNTTPYFIRNLNNLKNLLILFTKHSAN